MNRRLASDETVLLIDGKGRKYLVKLSDGGVFHYHRGLVNHDDVIGREEGLRLRSSGGDALLVLRPRLADFILKMPRGAAVVYPKDIGAIASFGDIAPGMTVLEAGTGSGALTLALLRFVGPNGRVVSVERREDHAAHARKTILRWLGEIPPNLELLVGDVETHIPAVRPQRLILDLPEPWDSVDLGAEHLPGGALLCSYLPTVPQIERLTEALAESGRFLHPEVFEILYRTWTIDGRSVRPDHRMVGHTGFLVISRKVDPVLGSV